MFSSSDTIPGPDPGACPTCGAWRKAGIVHRCPAKVPAKSIVLRRVQEARGCDDPDDCGKNVDGRDLSHMCVCRAACDDVRVFRGYSPGVSSVTLCAGGRYILTDEGLLLNEYGTELGSFFPEDDTPASERDDRP